VDDLARDPSLSSFSREVRVAAARLTVDRLRSNILAGKPQDLQEAQSICAAIASALLGSDFRAAINMSGVILHTGLGRARLASAVVQEIVEIASNHGYLELDVESGNRGDRQNHVRSMLKLLTGAEDALVVNNAAAAVVLTLRALASRKEVLLSRGQMVEIGGSFRVPDVAKQSGCKLVEVGTTNRTYLSDYAVGPSTAAILVCHRSNFEIVGFTTEPSLKELASLQVPVVDDMGTGCMVDLSKYGLPKLKTLADSVSQGASVAIGSGDKLLGGPQAGIIVGQSKYIQKLKAHPLARAMRIDKLDLAALAATLRLYLSGRELEIPTIKYLAKSVEFVRKDAERLASLIERQAIVEESVCEFGGGSGPGMTVPSYRVGLQVSNPDAFGRKLRQSYPGVHGRIERGVYWLDPRTAEPDEVDRTASIVRECLG
jgi:L-seryl-tRNA(Ser) seleniumtransferase